MTHTPIPHTLRTTFECEIRSTGEQDSYNYENNGLAVIDQNHHDPHPSFFDSFSSITVYIEDDHDQGFDIGIQSTTRDDDDWSGVVDEQVVTLAGGADVAKVEINGPVGRINYHFGTGGTMGTAPANGTTRISAIATL